MKRYRAAVIADSHFDRTSRWEECCRIHEWIVNDIGERAPDVIIHTGDVYERRTVPEERARAGGMFFALAKVAPVIVVRGNHDVVVDIEIFRSIGSTHRVVPEERCGIHYAGGFAVACLAWPRKAEILASHAAISGKVIGLPEGQQLAGDLLRQVISGMGTELENFDGPTILAAHAMVRGSKTSTGQPLVGCDMEIGIEDLALANADFNALGHVHRGQDWTYNDVDSVFPGSPRRTAYGELEKKGYVVVDFSREPFEGAKKSPRGWWVRWERIQTPATPMLLIDAVYQTEPGPAVLRVVGDLPDVQGADVRLRYSVASDQLEAGRAVAAELAAQMRLDGALDVKVEPIPRATTRARAPEIAAAKTLKEKLELLLELRGLVLTPERRLRLFDKLARLQEQL